MVRTLFAVVLTAAFFAQLPEHGAAAPESPAVHVYSCQVLSGGVIPQSDEIGLAVRFENLSGAPLSSIVWRAKYGTAYIDFIDDGTFSPQVRIDNFLLFEAGKRKFNWLGAVGDAAALAVGAYPPAGNLWNAPSMFGPYASYSDPENCAVVRTVSYDGTLWTNPAVAGQQPFVFPSPSPKPSGTPAPSPTPFVSGPVEISDCEYQVAGKAFLTVRFANTAARAATHVVFRVPYKDSGIDFSDQGKFSQGVAISHSLKQTLPPAFDQTLFAPLQVNFSDCAVVNVQYDDGSTWQNPAMPPTAAPLPTPPPDVLPAKEILRPHWQLHGFPTPVPSTSPATQ